MNLAIPSHVAHHLGRVAAPATVASELASAAARGDEVATQQLLASVTPRVTRVVRAVLGASHSDADDAIQQALIGFLQALPGFRGECEPVHFASRIAVRCAVAAARRTSRRRRHQLEDVDLDALAADGSMAADKTASAHRLRDVLRGLMTRIPAEQAEAIALRVVLGASVEEIARTMETPANTVRSRIRLAKKALRAAIEADPVLAEELDRDDG